MYKEKETMEIYTGEREKELQRFLDEESRNGFLPVQINVPAVQNITLQVCCDRWAVITKETEPRASFLSRHPQLINALERCGASPAGR